MSDSPLPIRLTQAVGLTTSLLLGGGNCAISVLFVPRLLESPAPLLLQQWNNLYQVGMRTFPPLAIVASVSYFYLARDAGFGESWKATAYAISGALTVGIIPYTLLFMKKVNGKLATKLEEIRNLGKPESVVEEEESVGEESAHQLLDLWGLLNLMRGLMLSTAGVLGVWTVLN